MWNKNNNGGHIYTITNFMEEGLQYFTIKYDICYTLFVDNVYQIKEIPIYSKLAESFYHE